MYYISLYYGKRPPVPPFLDFWVWGTSCSILWVQRRGPPGALDFIRGRIPEHGASPGAAGDAGVSRIDLFQLCGCVQWKDHKTASEPTGNKLAKGNTFATEKLGAGTLSKHMTSRASLKPPPRLDSRAISNI